MKQFALDPKISCLSLAGTPVHLTQREFDLALLLFQNLDMLLSREQIQETVWGRRAVNTSSRTIDRLHREVVAAMADPAIRTRFADMGAEPQASTPEELARHITAEIAKIRDIIGKAGIKLDP